MFNIDEMFIYAVSGLPGAWVYWIVGPVIIFYLISGFIQLIGMKSRAASIIGSIMPILVVTFMILAILDFVVPYTIIYLVDLSAVPILTNFLPIVVEFGTINFGIGTILVGLGGILALVSGFLPRE